MKKLVLMAILAAGPALAQVGGATGTATSPGLGGPLSGMAGPNDSGFGERRQDRGTGAQLPPSAAEGAGRFLTPGPGQPLPASPADRSPIGGSAVGGSGVPGTATGDMTTPR
jgi:hypothetical protein